MNTGYQPKGNDNGGKIRLPPSERCAHTLPVVPGQYVYLGIDTKSGDDIHFKFTLVEEVLAETIIVRDHMGTGGIGKIVTNSLDKRNKGYPYYYYVPGGKTLDVLVLKNSLGNTITTTNFLKSGDSDV